MVVWLKSRKAPDARSRGQVCSVVWGDGVAFTKVDWHLMDVFYEEKEKMEQEFHYYQFGIGLGRLTWALIIASLLIRFLE